MPDTSGHAAGSRHDLLSNDLPETSVSRAKLPPGPSEFPVIGQAFRLQRNLIELLQHAATYCDISTVSVNPLTICLANHPAFNRDVLLICHRTVAR